MATVTGLTADRMKAMEAQTVIDGDVVGNDLHLKTRDGTVINAGNVRGPQGPIGPSGGPPGPVGPMGPEGPPGKSLLMPQVSFEAATPDYAGNTNVSDMLLSNVPVLASHTYGIHLHSTIKFASVDVDARWDIWVRLNGHSLSRFCLLKPCVLGTTYLPVDSTVFWKPTVNASTDDLIVFIEEITNGATIGFLGSTDLPRSFAIFDFGQI